jgi:hypothetical protein
VLTAIKLLHTVIWAFLAASILALPVLAMLRRFRWAVILTMIVLLECGVLAVNGGRCPLTDLAARYTVDRGSNFDIYLPSWLAEHNKLIFGTLFVLSELIVVCRWRGSAVEQTVKAGVLYFMLVLCRICFGHDPHALVVPKLGVRTAELIEAPLMFGLSILAARWVARRLRFPPDYLRRLASGCVALGLMLLVEFTFVLWIRGLTIREYFATRDPISGTVYFLTLGVFAIPVFVERQPSNIAPGGIPT